VTFCLEFSTKEDSTLLDEILPIAIAAASSGA
jgi:hypothetical protein